MASDDCDYGVDHLGPWCLMTVITEWTALDHDVWWLCLRSGQPWTMTSGDCDYEGGPHWTMTSDDCDCWGVDHHGPWCLMTDYGMDGPPRTMMYDDCDCGVDHLGSRRLMPVITEWTTMDHVVWWLQLHRGPHWTMTSNDRDYIGGSPWTMTYDDRDYIWGPPWTMTSDCLWIRGGPHWTMTSDDCDCGVDNLGPWRLVTVITKVDHLGPWRMRDVITEWTTLDHDVWWLWLRRWTILDLDVWWLLLRNGPLWTTTSDDCDCAEWTTLDKDV